jgi:hypothetical protein
VQLENSERNSAFLSETSISLSERVINIRTRTVKHRFSSVLLLLTVDAHFSAGHAVVFLQGNPAEKSFLVACLAKENSLLKVE